MSSIELADKLFEIKKKTDEAFDEQIRSLFDSFVKETVEPLVKGYGCKLNEDKGIYRISHPEWEHGCITVGSITGGVVCRYLFKESSVEEPDDYAVINFCLLTKPGGKFTETPENFFRGVINFYKERIYPDLFNKSKNEHEQYPNMIDESTWKHRSLYF